MFRSWRKTRADDGRGRRQRALDARASISLMGFSYNVLASMLVPLIVVLAIADDVHIMQHWDEERRHGDGGDGVQGDRRAPRGAAARRQRHHRARHAVAGHEQRRGGAVVRRRRGGRDHGRLRDLAGVRADAAEPDEAGDRRGAARALPACAPMRRVARVLDARIRARVLAVCAGARRWWLSLGILRLRVDTNHINFFSANHPLGQSAAVIDTKLAGIYSFQILLEGPPDSLKTPDALQRMDRLAERAAASCRTSRKVTSVADYVKRVQQGAERRPAGRRTSSRPTPTPSRRSCSSSRSAARGGTSSSAWWPATTRARRSPSSSSR